MGTYIFDYVEIKENGKWKLLGDVFENSDFKKNKPISESNNPKTRSPLGLCQHYDLFSILADVRNWDEEIEPIAYPKGIPKNASKEYKEIAKSDDDDEHVHSHSYFTLKELLDFNWDKEYDKNSIVEKDGFLKFKEKGKLAHSSQGVQETDIFIVSNHTMEHIIKGEYLQKMLLLEAKVAYRMMREDGWNSSRLSRHKEIIKKVKNFDFDFTYQTTVTWKETYRQTAGEEWFNVLEQMKKLAPEGNYRNIRYLFFFVS